MLPMQTNRIRTRGAYTRSVDLPEDLEREIADAADDDRGPLLVAADWLAQRGDPVGELLALSLNINGRALAKVGAARLVELARAHAIHLPGTRHLVAYRYGLVDRIAIAGPAALAALLAQPVARFVRALRVVGGSAHEAVRALRAVRPLAALRELHLLGDPTEEVDLDELLPRLPRLAVLHVAGRCERVAHPTLRELTLHASSDQEAGPALAAFELAAPALATLRYALIGAVPDTLARAVVARREVVAFGGEARDVLQRSLPMPIAGTVARIGSLRVDAARSPAWIGRAHDCALVLDDAVVPRRAVAIHVTPQGRVRVEDGSDGGVTYVNGFRAREAELRDGDELVIGLTALRVQLGGGSSTSSSPVQ